MGYYILKDKRGPLEMSETEGLLLSLATFIFMAIIALIYLSIIGALILITLNCGALFRNHGRKFAWCFVPVYNLFLCSKILTGKGLVLLGIISTFYVDAIFVYGLLNDSFNFGAVGIAVCSVLTISLVILHFWLVGYFNRQISKLDGVDWIGYKKRVFMDVCPIISWITLAIFLVRDMRKY